MLHYALSLNINDYLQSVKRSYSKAKTTANTHSNISQIKDSKGNQLNVLDLVYRPPSINLIITAVLSDPFASLFAPFVVLVRWAAMNTGEISTSDTWDSIESTKILKI